MPTTLGVSYIAGQPPDLDGTIVTGFESLRQRIVQAIRFRLGEWFLRTNRGLPYTDLIGHRTTAGLAAATLTQAIRDEGGAEVEAVTDVRWSLTHPRRFRYQATVDTIYGPTAVDETLT